jgi:hypothetical protein
MLLHELLNAAQPYLQGFANGFIFAGCWFFGFSLFIPDDSPEAKCILRKNRRNVGVLFFPGLVLFIVLLLWPRKDGYGHEGGEHGSQALDDVGPNHNNPLVSLDPGRG